MDGTKTTVKTTAQIDEQQQQSVSDTSNDGLVYSAVVVKDGIKTILLKQQSSKTDRDKSSYVCYVCSNIILLLMILKCKLGGH